MSTPHILIVEDQRALAMALAAAVRQSGASSEIAPTAAVARQWLESSERGFSGMILDIGLPDENGLDFYAGLPAETRPPALVVTAHGEIDKTIAARKLGIAEFLTKPLDFERFRDSLERILPEPAEETDSRSGPSDRGATTFIGASKAMRPIFQQVAHACASGEPVLISGETGTGKTLVASVIRHNSTRGEVPFAAFHCSGEKRVEELRQALEAARGGILLVEEIENLDPESQGELIRFWESGETRFPRILATCDPALRDAVDAGDFRSDLYYRLQVLAVRLPPLRDRIEDLPALFDFFLAEVAPDRVLQVDTAALQQLSAYPWPGNLRELHNVATFAATVSGGAARIGTLDLPDHLKTEVAEAVGGDRDLDRVLAGWIEAHLEERDESGPTYRELSAALERRLIRLLLDRHDGKLARLATEMKANRTTLRKKLKGS